MSELIECMICERIAAIRMRTNPTVVAELETGFVVIGDTQFFRGYTLFLCKQHVSELHELEPDLRQRFLAEMSQVAEAVYNWVRPRKMNYELLGNSEPHLHWHLFPRHADDPHLHGPVWQVDEMLRGSEQYRPVVSEYERLSQELLAELRRIPGIRIVAEG